MATAGMPMQFKFDYRTKEFIYRFQHQSGIQEPTIIYIPEYQYPEGCQVEISDGTYEINTEEQFLTYWHGADHDEHLIKVKPE
jgi:hypothetical protein